MDALDLFNGKGLFARHVLAGPSSQKQLPKDMSLLDAELNVTTRSSKSGTNYANEYIEKEEKELLESASYHNTNGQSKFDDVSVGTEATQNLYNDEDSLNVYKTFAFTYNPKKNLSILFKRDQIISMIETNSVVVIQGPTGCGKTTQVPQFILDSCCKKNLHCNIIVTQPRRIAAISIAKRVSEERNWPLGSLVGYQVGLLNQTCKDTRLTYCTTGVLLHKLINAKNMLNFTHIILDEVHERAEDMDLLLFVVRKLLRTNSRLVKVILMSATFQTIKFAKYFSSPVRDQLVPAPIIEIAQKTYFNISIFYLCQLGALGPLPEISATEPVVSKKMMEFCVNIITILDDIDMKADDVVYCPETNVYERHVILVFLPGIHEIEEMYNLLLPKRKLAKWDTMVLHSSITNEEQQRIFQKPPHGYRRIILSTNIAESSITVPDVKHVIDFCLTKQLIVNPKTNFQCLELTWASKQNCDQRAGRTGRVMHGRVYRLVPQTFYEAVLPKEAPPEILRAPLGNTVLKAKLLDMGEPKAVLALTLDPPDLANLERTILILKEVGGLIDKPNEFQPFDGKLTDLGQVMARLPLDTRITKLIMLGHVYSVLYETTIIAACLAVKDVFDSPFQQKMSAYNTRLTWAADSSSDCIAFMNVYKVWILNKANGTINSNAAEKRWASQNFVQIRVLREIKALVTELKERLRKMGIVESEGINKVTWKGTELPIVLKIVIAGAYYPNYFVKHVPDGQQNQNDGLKLLNGLDPCKTVYMQGWPMRQPGYLYAKRIQDIFEKHVASKRIKVIVSFDGSSRVYVQFVEDQLPNNKDNNGDNNTTKKISRSVYKAIKMRQSNVSLQIPILNEDFAIKRAEKECLKGTQYFHFARNIKTCLWPRLPSIRSSRIPIVMCQVDSPGKFWIQVRDSRVKEQVDRISYVIDKNLNYLNSFDSVPETGTVVIAPYKMKHSISHFRAIVMGSITSPEILVQLYYLDYGCSGECCLSDLKRVDNIELAEFPALAIQCVLAKLQPSTADDMDNNWSGAASNFFRALVHKPGLLYGDIYSIVNGIMALGVILEESDGKEIDINQSLIGEGFAKEKEEGYFSRFNHGLRMKQAELTDEQCQRYEQLQYNQDCAENVYPYPPTVIECCGSVNLRGPFSPLEVDLRHLTIANKDNRIKVMMNSVNAVLLDNDPENSSQRLLVAGCISQSAYNNTLTLHNTTLMPRLPGLTALLGLIFAPSVELRRNTYGTYYIGALCGLGFDPNTKRNLFPEHDLELQFDAEIDINDLQDINKLRHWMNIGMNINSNFREGNSMEDTITCQTKIKETFLKLFEKERKPQTLETINNFDKWNLYDDPLYLRPNRVSLVANNIFKLHNALELEETDRLLEIIEHTKKLQELMKEDPRKPGNTNIPCKVCNVVLNDIYGLRSHLFSTSHKNEQKRLGIHF
ncbi:putative ATP-dependent RNA helicase spindle-E [Augochlora pura]